MDFRFSDDHLAMRDAVRDAVSRACPTPVLRAIFNGDDTARAGVWRTVHGLGLPSLRLPESDGGLGLALVCGLAARGWHRPGGPSAATKHQAQPEDESVACLRCLAATDATRAALPILVVLARGRAPGAPCGSPPVLTVVVKGVVSR